MNNKIAVYPGSFDPVTLGHVDIATRAAKLFGTVIVTVMTNYSKKSTFSTEERLDLLKRSLQDYPNIQVDAYDGLLAEYASAKKAGVIVKGLRAMSDFEIEFQMALINRQLNPEVETVFLNTDSQFMYLSSSMVRQGAQYGGDISRFVPAAIAGDIIRKFANP